ncbi:hypothetical protein PUNSTDRAFT_54457 [Punctularia strigosozonata HHB-11173 SS5]|uniref:uncharacterized protein n=1 Tax=Punctularia strigosozonata (strain HHB-11173) TaxID=741275 RepID=UPI0004416A7B|nr:uncharacterized protein PUNSTDRAFT_54457 [Punctularia strigosozonata HHB-11173 SS5]EIN06182.1 hypothetical protein PUNSTDRAFT_54457 [Punctularia strigosozonata HHB-11173 SS5]
MDVRNSHENAAKIVEERINAFVRGVSASPTHDWSNVDKISQRLATDAGMRSDMTQYHLQIWQPLRHFWQLLAAEEVGRDVDDDRPWDAILSVARLTRNLIAAVSENQKLAYEYEPAIRELLFQYTTFTLAKDADSYPAVRMLVQTISNIITSNDELSAKLWITYMSLPHEKSIVLRLLTHPDTRTRESCMVLVLNCISGSEARIQSLIETSSGVRICVTLLDQIAAASDSDDGEESRIFDIGYTILSQVIAAGLFPSLYVSCSVAGETVSPHQAVLLKLLDSYLHANQSSKTPTIHADACDSLLAIFDKLGVAARASITRSLGAVAESAGDAELKGVDLDLPKVCEALVLATQCLTTIVLAWEDGQIPSRAFNPRKLLEEARNKANEGFAEGLVDLLRQLDRFIPKLQFGKPIGAAPNANATAASTGEVGFFYLKRDLVRLLGVLAWSSRSIQDRVRACDGIPVVMNLCVVDERNPFMREHALFALRNLLHSNEQNQAIVDQIRPSAKWDEDGVLRETAGTVWR